MRWLAILLLSTVPALAGTFKLEREGFLSFRGEIVGGDARKLSARLKTMKPYNGSITLMLDSIGGEYEEGVRMADAVLVARRKVTIVAAVPWLWECSSSCVTVFAAATEREVGIPGEDKQGAYWKGGQLWVHMVASTVHGRPVIDKDAAASTWAWSRILKTLDVPPAVIDKLVTTESRVGTRLTQEDLKQWGVKFRAP